MLIETISLGCDDISPVYAANPFHVKILFKKKKLY